MTTIHANEKAADLICGYEGLNKALGHVSAVMWLGAGFSRCAMLGRSPLMCDFFAELDPAKYPHLAIFLEMRHSKLSDANVEDVLLAVDQIEDSPLDSKIRREMMANQDPRIVKHELLNYCLARLDFRGVPNTWAAEFLACATRRTTVITTNYDTIPEQILSNKIGATHCSQDATCHHCNMQSFLKQNCGCDRSAQTIKPKNASLLKLHGSICWHVCRNKACVNVDCLVPICNCEVVLSPRCSCCESGNDPVIVLPSMQKTYKDFPQIGRMWDLADEALNLMEIFIVFGFSFPSSDSLISNMVMQAIRKSSRLREVLLVDVNPYQVASKLRAMCGSRPGIVFKELVVPKDGATPAWVNEGMRAAIDAKTMST